MDKFEITFKPSFYSKIRKLEFKEDSLCLFKKGKLLKKIDRNDFSAIRFGIKWIQGSEFIIGRVYCIYVRGAKNDTIAIKLRILYGVRRKQLYAKCNEIIDKLYEFYFEDLITKYLNEIENGNEVEMAGSIFKKEGVQLDKKNKKSFLPWEDIESRAYYYYYTLSSRSNPGIYKAYMYLTDWNAVAVFGLSRSILTNRGLYGSNLQSEN